MLIACIQGQQKYSNLLNATSIPSRGSRNTPTCLMLLASHPGQQKYSNVLNATSIPSRGSRNTPTCLMLLASHPEGAEILHLCLMLLAGIQGQEKYSNSIYVTSIRFPSRGSRNTPTRFMLLVSHPLWQETTFCL